MTTTTLPSDPWATNDHDPTSHLHAPILHAAALTTTHALAMAREDIHQAVNDDDHRRRQYPTVAASSPVSTTPARTARPSGGPLYSRPGQTPFTPSPRTAV